MATDAVRLISLLLLALWVATPAFSREEDGRLDVVVSPSNVQPFIGRPGDSLDVFITDKVSLRIESESGSFPLASTSAERWRGLWRIRTSIPTGAPDGTYTLATANGDTAYRAVYVSRTFPDTYRLAHLSNLRVGEPGRSDSVLFRVTSEINEKKPDLVVVTGDLTNDGTADQFRIALDAVNDLLAPTMVIYGAKDDQHGLAADFVGPAPIALNFGPDGFLLIPPLTATDSGVYGRLYRERRRIRPARWSVGVAAASPANDLRADLTLLVDDPLDFLFLGAPDSTSLLGSSWGRTTVFASNAQRARVDWFVVGARPIEPAAD